MEGFDEKFLLSTKRDEVADDRFVSSAAQEGDNDVENVLRPKTMADYVGQDKVKENLEVYIKAAKKGATVLTTCCFMAPQGLEKPPCHTLLQANLARALN